MPSTTTQTCALCGLRYANGALLDLHIREDHIQHNQQGAPARSEGAAGRASPTRVGTSHSSARTSRLPRPVNRVTAATATPRPRRRLAGPAMAAVHRFARGARQAAQAVRYVNEELLRASEAISLRHVAEPQRPRQSRARSDARPASESTEPARRAA